MRITFLTPPDGFSGGLRVVALYARELKARGHEVTIVSNARPRPGLRAQLRALRHGRWREEWQKAMPQHGHLSQSGVPLRTLERARPIVAADVPDADVVVATWWETAAWMHDLPASKGLKVHLVQGYETWTEPETFARVQATLRLPNVKIAISSGLKHDIESALGDLGMTVIPNAVDLEQFDAPVRTRNAIPRLGYLYAQTPIKGADRCLAIVDEVRRHIPGLQVLAFGADEVSPSVPLPEGTEYHHRPAQDALAGLYAHCDVWLFATRVDSFGLPLLEAMACRTPVVGLPIGAAPDLLVDGRGVLVYPEGEHDAVEAMASAVLRLLRAPSGEWQSMSTRAHQRAHAYGWAEAVDRFETLIRGSMAAGKAMPA